jgi:formate-dependent phosphoribosylglycinamide formyltransferase (GAR transformylase)
MAYVRLSVGIGGALDMFEFELFIRARLGQPIQMSTTTDPLPCQNINTVLNDIQQKLQKLDILDSISERLRNIPGCCP